MNALGWILLVVALACGVVLGLPWIAPGLAPPSAVYDAAMLSAPALQLVGVFALRRAGVARGWAVVIGYLAAVAFVVAWIGATMGVAAGAGGMVYALFMLMPGIALGLLLQVAALILFAMRKRAGSGA